MAFMTKSAESPKGWSTGKIYGFKISKNGDWIQALLEVGETKETASYCFSNPPKLSEINKLATAVGRSAYNPGQDIEYPSVDDSDKLGWATPIEIFVQEKNGYLNITKFRKGDGSFKTEGPF